MIFNRSILGGLAASILMSLVACSSDEGAVPGTDGGAGSTGTNDASIVISGDAGADGDAATLSDAQIFGVLAWESRGEINVANLAPTRASDPQVLAFAQMMITDHTQALNRGTALASTYGLTPAASPTSQSLDASAASTVATLTALSGPTFDRAYIQSQVDMHTTVLRLIDEQLLPSATLPQLRSELTTTRAAVVQHLGNAQTIAQSIADGGVEAGPTTL